MTWPHPVVCFYTRLHLLLLEAVGYVGTWQTRSVTGYTFPGNRKGSITAYGYHDGGDVGIPMINVEVLPATAEHPAVHDWQFDRRGLV